MAFAPLFKRCSLEQRKTATTQNISIMSSHSEYSVYVMAFMTSQMRGWIRVKNAFLHLLSIWFSFGDGFFRLLCLCRSSIPKIPFIEYVAAVGVVCCCWFALTITEVALLGVEGDIEEELFWLLFELMLLMQCLAFSAALFRTILRIGEEEDGPWMRVRVINRL